MAEFPKLTDLFPDLPAPDFTQAMAYPMMRQWEQATLQLPGAAPTTLVSIADGSITPAGASCRVDTEGQANTDELRTINVAAIHDGAEVYLYAAYPARTVVVKHNPHLLNGISLTSGADTALSPTGYVHLKREGGHWCERQAGAVGAFVAKHSVSHEQLEMRLDALDTVMFKGKIELLPLRPADLALDAPGWHFCNGDQYPLSSPVGRALSALPTNLKNDFGIVLSGESISIPNLFYTDGRGVFLRAVNGTSRAIGSIELDQFQGHAHSQRASTAGYFGGSYNQNAATIKNDGRFITTDIKDPIDYLNGPVRYGTETRGLNIGMTPAIFLGV